MVVEILRMINILDLLVAQIKEQDKIQSRYDSFFSGHHGLLHKVSLESSYLKKNGTSYWQCKSGDCQSNWDSFSGD